MRAGVEPGEAARKGLNLEFAIFQKFLIDSGYLKFAAGRRLYIGGYIDYFVGVEVETDYGVVAFGMFGLLFDREAVAVAVKFGHAVAFGIVDPVAEDGGFSLVFGCGHGVAQHAGEAGAMEYVVAEHEAGAVVADEVAPDDEGLCQTVGRGLLGVFKADSEVGTVAEEAAESGEVVWGGDDEDFADTGLHQCGDGVVDHRFVEDRKHLLADAFGDRVETGAGTTGQHYAFHMLEFVSRCENRETAVCVWILAR